MKTVRSRRRAVPGSWIERVGRNATARFPAMISAVLLTACSTLPANTTDWRGKTLALAVYPPSELQLIGHADYLLIGATQGTAEPGKSAGAKLQAENAIEDLALRVARSLFLAAQQEYGVVAAADISAPRLANPTELTHLAQGVDLLLDVTSGSTVGQRPFSSRYEVNTTMIGRVIDVHTGKAFGDTLCQIRGGGDPDFPTYDELVANDAARLKAILAKEADSCVEKLKTDVLGIHRPAS